MSQAHFCNTFFEMELESMAMRQMTDWFRLSPITLQLQFLPLIYADEKDSIFVSDLPDFPDPRLKTFNTPLDRPVSSWGPSKQISHWAKEKNTPYHLPDWDLVKKINSKIFSHLESTKLPNAALLDNEKEIELWSQSFAGPKVLKSPFGTSGRGHFHLGGNKHLSSYLSREFSKGLPLIGEPWVERSFDFSSQWNLDPMNSELLGITSIENNQNGSYLSTHLESNLSSYQWAIDEHLSVAKPLVEKICKLGYFGNLGIDAFVYLWNGAQKLQPIVEINGRKTMSWAALQLYKKLSLKEPTSLSYCHSKTGLLPSSLKVQGKKIVFTKNLVLRSKNS